MLSLIDKYTEYHLSSELPNGKTITKNTSVIKYLYLGSGEISPKHIEVFLESGEKKYIDKYIFDTCFEISKIPENLEMGIVKLPFELSEFEDFEYIFYSDLKTIKEDYEESKRTNYISIWTKCLVSYLKICGFFMVKDPFYNFGPFIISYSDRHRIIKGICDTLKTSYENLHIPQKQLFELLPSPLFVFAKNSLHLDGEFVSKIVLISWKGAPFCPEAIKEYLRRNSKYIKDDPDYTRILTLDSLGQNSYSGPQLV